MNDRALYPPESRPLDTRTLSGLLREAQLLAAHTGRGEDWRRVDKLEDEVATAEQRERQEQR